jgi:hypothetical protein
MRALYPAKLGVPWEGLSRRAAGLDLLSVRLPELRRPARTTALPEPAVGVVDALPTQAHDKRGRARFGYEALPIVTTAAYCPCHPDPS